MTGKFLHYSNYFQARTRKKREGMQLKIHPARIELLTLIVRYPPPPPKKKQARTCFATLSLQASRDVKSIATGPLWFWGLGSKIHHLSVSAPNMVLSTPKTPGFEEGNVQFFDTKSINLWKKLQNNKWFHFLACTPLLQLP